MPIITIDGNIGAGKTTLLNYLHSNYNIFIDLEPVEKWKPYLDNIYINNKNHFSLQLRVWLDRSWIQEKNKTLMLMERSPYFIRNTFNTHMYNNNLISNQEYILINELYDKTDEIWKSNFYIYLRSNPENCLERILERGRENETNINIDYLSAIHDLHEETYKNALELNFNILVIDIEDKTIEEIAFIVIKYLNKIKN